MLLLRSRNLLIIVANAVGAASPAGAGFAGAQEPTPNPPAPSLPAAPDPSAPPQDAPVVAVTGRVIDVLSKAVAGATVRVEATGESATTERDGKFRLSGAVGASLVVR